jgi:hypothetical protein
MIEGYEFGRIVIDGKTYTSDVIIYPDRVDGSWWRKEGHELCISDLAKILPEKPEVLIVGTGNAGIMRILEETKSLCSSRSIELIAEPTGKAWKTYNQLSSQKRVIAALHLTC